MNELNLTGGAKIGMVSATFPFATLKVNKDLLELNVSLVGNLVFQPSDIISIEPYTLIPVLGQGLKINHKVSNYQKRVIFYTFKNPNSILWQIQEIGFLGNENQTNPKIERTIIDKQANGGFAIKKGFAIGAIVVWNVLFLTNFIPFFPDEKERLPIGIGVLTAVGLLFLTALFSLISSDFRRLILKEGRELKDIKKFAIFAMILSGFMFVYLGITTKMFN